MSTPLKRFANYSDPDFDKEFAYDIDEKVAAEVAAYENAPRHDVSSQQAKEEFARRFEDNVESRKQYRFANQEEFKGQRTGKILSMGEFMRRLLTVDGVVAHYTDRGGLKGTLGLYAGRNGRPKEYICFVQVPLMQEYEEMHFDRYDVPLNTKRRGWRTVLLRLIEKRVLTESEANEAFGEPASGPVSRRYREHLQWYRGRSNA